MDNKIIKIRKVKPEDARGWFILVNEVWRDAYSHIFSEEVFIEQEKRINEKIDNFTNDMRNDNENIAYVAEYNGKIIGIMRGRINSSYEHFFSDYADLEVLYINPKFQGNGIETLFKKAFEKWAKENGASKYVIGVLKDNIKAREVYERWRGELSEYENGFAKNNVEYPEVFYLYNL